MQILINKVTEVSKEYKFNINIKKTKVMFVTKEQLCVPNIIIEDMRLNTVISYKYFSWIINN